MSPVTSKQLLIHPTEHGRKALEAVDTLAGADLWDYEDLDSGVEVPPLGTSGLLVLAARLSEHGYSVSDIDLRDERFNALPEEFEQQVANYLRVRIRSGDLVDQSKVEQLIAENGIVLTGIGFRVRGTGQYFTLNLDGQVRGRSDEPWERFISDVSAALGYEAS